MFFINLLLSHRLYFNINTSTDLLHTLGIKRIIIIKALQIVFTLNERHKYGVKPNNVVFITIIKKIKL